jgi:hypothetical protein
MRKRLWGLGCALLLLAGCANQQNLLKTTITGGDALPQVKVSPTGQPDASDVNIGDTVVFAPGSMRAVVRSPQVVVTLFESVDATQSAIKKELSVNRREGAKIEVLKGKLIRGDFIATSIAIDLNDPDPKRLDLDLVLLAFNRGEKPFRGDLTVYDLLPPELQYVGADPAAKYNDRRGVKEALSIIPIVSLFSAGLDNFSRSSEIVEMRHDMLDQIHKYTFSRLVLDPGQAVGFKLRLRYVLPTGDELTDLRLESKPIQPQRGGM